jgi:hypothetical protein
MDSCDGFLGFDLIVLYGTSGLLLGRVSHHHGGLNTRVTARGPKTEPDELSLDPYERIFQGAWQLDERKLSLCD